MNLFYAIVGTALLLLASSMAQSAEIDFSAPLMDQDNRNMTDCAKWSVDKTPQVCDEIVPLTLGRLALTALNRADEKALSAQDNVRRGLLARRVWKGGKLDLDASDIELIKTQIAALRLPPLVVVAAFEILDPASVKK